MTIGLFILTFIILKVASCTIGKYIFSPKENKRNVANPNPFVVSEYLDRIEKASLEILNDNEPVGQTIILWWGLDGLRLNEDGTTEWTSRQKSNLTCNTIPNKVINTMPVGMFSALCDTAGLITAKKDQVQSTRAQIEELMTQNAALQMQAIQNIQNIQIINDLQMCCVEFNGYYAPYYHAGNCNFVR